MLAPPAIKGMSVFGAKSRNLPEIVLLFEEYETIRLLDYKGMTQEEAARQMLVSRPTLTRIYEDARKKVAQALSEGRGLLIRGGDFFFDDNWYRCNDCKTSFSFYEGKASACLICSSANIANLNDFYKES